MKRLITILFASALVLAACGGSDSKGSSSSGSADFNDADVTFVQGMIPHHEQAVEMADLALENGTSADVKALAEKIKGAQDPEIETMKGFLKDWGKDESEGSDDMGGMDSSGDSAEMGMMSDDEMADLEAASGAEFDTMFLEMMTKHHEGAVAMAETEQADGKSADAKDLAGRIIKAQKAEITEMKALTAGGA